MLTSKTIKYVPASEVMSALGMDVENYKEALSEEIAWSFGRWILYVR
jgi:hypothetical protein